VSNPDLRGEVLDYLLGELPDDQRARCERRLGDDPEFAAEVEWMRPLVGHLQGMSSRAWDHVDAVQGLTPPLPLARTRRARQWRPVFSLAAAALAAAAVVLVLALTPGTSKAPPRQVELSALSGVTARAHATATIVGSERVAVDVQYLPPTDAKHYYELWLMTTTTHLVSVAAFRVDGSGYAQLSLPLPAAPAQYRYLNISLQQAGAGAGISSQSMLRGPIART
jgi:anti-sigma-K factor RskA